MHPQETFPRPVVYELDSANMCLWDHYEDGWFIKNNFGSIWNGEKWCWFNGKRFHEFESAFEEFKTKIAATK